MGLYPARDFVYSFMYRDAIQLVNGRLVVLLRYPVLPEMMLERAFVDLRCFFTTKHCEGNGNI
jgi:hypothetical protein